MFQERLWLLPKYLKNASHLLLLLLRKVDSVIPGNIYITSYTDVNGTEPPANTGVLWSYV